MVETSSRKVLKELLGNFSDTAEDLKKQVSSVDEKIRANKARVEKQELQIKSVVQTVKDVVSFSKRLAQTEQKIDSIREKNEKGHEGMRDFVTRTKEMLEGRIDQI